MSDHNLFNYFFANCEDYDDITADPLHEGSNNLEEPDSSSEYNQNLNLDGLLNFDTSFDYRAESNGQKMEETSAGNIELQAIETHQDFRYAKFRLCHKDDNRDEIEQRKMKQTTADFDEDDFDDDQDDIKSSEAYTVNVPLDPSGISLFDNNNFPKDEVGNNSSRNHHQLHTISHTKSSTQKLEKLEIPRVRMRFPIPRDKAISQKRRKPNNPVKYQSTPQLYQVPGFSKPIVNRQSLHHGRITSIEECKEAVNVLNGGTLDVVEDQRTKRKIVDFLQLYGYSLFSVNENQKTDGDVVRNDVNNFSQYQGDEEKINWSELFPFEEADKERYGPGSKQINREHENLHHMDASATILNAGDLRMNHSGIDKKYLAACNAISNSEILTVSPVVITNRFNPLKQPSGNQVNTIFSGLERWKLSDSQKIGLPSIEECECDPIVYVTMGQLAIRNSPYKFLTVDQIVSFILHHWPYFRFSNYVSWKQSLTLALRRSKTIFEEKIIQETNTLIFRLINWNSRILNDTKEKFFENDPRGLEFILKMNRGEMGLPRQLFYYTVGLCAPEFSGPENSSIFYHLLSLGLVPRKLCKLFRPHFECLNINEPRFVEAFKGLSDDLSKPEFLEGFGVNMVNGRPGRFEEGMADRFHTNIDWYFDLQKHYAERGFPNWTTPPLNSSFSCNTNTFRMI